MKDCIWFDQVRNICNKKLDKKENLECPYNGPYARQKCDIRDEDDDRTKEVATLGTLTQSPQQTAKDNAKAQKIEAKEAKKKAKADAKEAKNTKNSDVVPEPEGNSDLE